MIWICMIYEDINKEKCGHMTPIATSKGELQSQEQFHISSSKYRTFYYLFHLSKCRDECCWELDHLGAVLRNIQKNVVIFGQVNCLQPLLLL